MVLGWFKKSGKPPQKPVQPSFEDVWKHREEDVYPSLFGQASSRGIFVPSIDLFTDTFRQTEVDPRWLHHGVLEFGPSMQRGTWLYVTSGTSNAWEQDPEDYDPDDYSGIGTELVLEVPSQSDWAVDCLSRLLAYNVLLAHGRFGDAQPLDYGARVPIGGPINGDPASLVRFVVISEPSSFSPTFQLASGRVDFLQVVGITEAERDLARSEGTATLIDRLKTHAHFPLTDPSRASVA